MRFILTIFVASAICSGCASITYKDKEGRELSYSRFGSQSIKGVSIEPTENGVKMSLESAQSDAQALSSAALDLVKTAASSAK